MAWQALRHMIPRQELIGVLVLAIIGAALLALAPAKNADERTSAVGS